MMKPRLDIAPLTTEDLRIAEHVMMRQIVRWRPSLDNWMKAQIGGQDRRDADLMLRAQSDTFIGMIWTGGPIEECEVLVRLGTYCAMLYSGIPE